MAAQLVKSTTVAVGVKLWYPAAMAGLRFGIPRYNEFNTLKEKENHILGTGRE
jgi:hypothetical protein